MSIFDEKFLQELEERSKKLYEEKGYLCGQLRYYMEKDKHSYESAIAEMDTFTYLLAKMSYENPKMMLLGIDNDIKKDIFDLLIVVFVLGYYRRDEIAKLDSLIT